MNTNNNKRFNPRVVHIITRKQIHSVRRFCNRVEINSTLAPGLCRVTFVYRVRGDDSVLAFWLRVKSMNSGDN